jgi:hypothetical protein
MAEDRTQRFTFKITTTDGNKLMGNALAIGVLLVYIALLGGVGGAATWGIRVHAVEALPLQR